MKKFTCSSGKSYASGGRVSESREERMERKDFPNRSAAAERKEEKIERKGKC